MDDEQPEPSDEWRLESVSLSFMTYGEHKGKYAGSITFQNGENESFKFKVRPDMAQDYIDLIASDIVKGAANLADRLLVSLGLIDGLPEEETDGPR